MEDFVITLQHWLLTLSALIMQGLPVVTKLLGLVILILQVHYWIKKNKE